MVTSVILRHDLGYIYSHLVGRLKTYEYLAQHTRTMPFDMKATGRLYWEPIEDSSLLYHEGPNARAT